MKVFKLFLIFFVFTCTSKNADAQNVLLNILTQNSGIVNKNGTVFLEVSVCNTSATTAVPEYKLRPQLSFPAELVSLPDTGHILPPGWTITSNTGAVIRLSNGDDQIPPTGCRTILILMKGKNIGGRSTISGNMTFSSGIAPGSVSGSATAGDNPADNASTSTIQVIK